jgi:hypothetical protein
MAAQALLFLQFVPIERGTDIKAAHRAIGAGHLARPRLGKSSWATPGENCSSNATCGAAANRLHLNEPPVIGLMQINDDRRHNPYYSTRLRRDAIS